MSYTDLQPVQQKYLSPETMGFASQISPQWKHVTLLVTANGMVAKRILFTHEPAENPHGN
jgi:hypothetical protein